MLDLASLARSLVGLDAYGRVIYYAGKGKFATSSNHDIDFVWDYSIDDYPLVESTRQAVEAVNSFGNAVKASVKPEPSPSSNEGVRRNDGKLKREKQSDPFYLNRNTRRRR